MGVATLVFSRRLRASIEGEKSDAHVLTLVLSALVHLDPFQVTIFREYAFWWIAGLLNSRHPDSERYRMASMVIQLLGKHIDYNDSQQFHPSWVSPLLRFLALGEQFYLTGSPPHPGFTAFRMLIPSPGCFGSGATILPILASTLQPTHPLQARVLALRVFYRFVNEWFSLQMENVLNKDLSNLLQAVGDPFQFLDLPPLDGQHVITVDYEPMMAVVVLIEFSSSDLYLNHLRRSNFTSCETILSAEEGRRTALKCMLDTATHSRPEFLRTPANIIVAIGCLEELQCLNTAEAVILWAWTPGVVNAVDHDDWGLIGRATLRFYRTHGMERLAALKRHIVGTDTTTEPDHLELLQGAGYGGSLCGVGSARRPVPVTEEVKERYLIDLRASRVCQLRRLYHLFGYDPVTWGEAVAGGEVGEEVDASLGCSVTLPIQFMDCACDYP